MGSQSTSSSFNGVTSVTKKNNKTESLNSTLQASSSSVKSSLWLWISVGVNVLLLASLIISIATLSSNNSRQAAAISSLQDDLDKANEDAQKATNALAGLKSENSRLEKIVSTVAIGNQLTNQLTLSGQKVNELSIKVGDAIQNATIDITTVNSLFGQLQQEVNVYNNLINQYLLFLSSNQVALEETKLDVQATIKATKEAQDMLNQQISLLSSIITTLGP